MADSALGGAFNKAVAGMVASVGIQAAAVETPPPVTPATTPMTAAAETPTPPTASDIVVGGLTTISKYVHTQPSVAQLAFTGNALKDAIGGDVYVGPESVPKVIADTVSLTGAAGVGSNGLQANLKAERVDRENTTTRRIGAEMSASGNKGITGSMFVTQSSLQDGIKTKYGAYAVLTNKGAQGIGTAEIKATLANNWTAGTGIKISTNGEKSGYAALCAPPLKMGDYLPAVDLCAVTTKNDGKPIKIGLQLKRDF
jgi:hypothetical protein